MREQHLQGDRGVGEAGIADLETEQVAHIVGEGELALLDLLQQAGGRERLGDGSDAEDRLVVYRFLGGQVLYAEVLVVDDLVVLYHGAADADRVDFGKKCLHVFFKFLGGGFAARKQQGGHQAEGKESFFHFYGFFTDSAAENSGLFPQILLQR